MRRFIPPSALRAAPPGTGGIKRRIERKAVTEAGRTETNRAQALTKKLGPVVGIWG